MYGVFVIKWAVSEATVTMVLMSWERRSSRVLSVEWTLMIHTIFFVALICHTYETSTWFHFEPLCVLPIFGTNERDRTLCPLNPSAGKTWEDMRPTVTPVDTTSNKISEEHVAPSAHFFLRSPLTSFFNFLLRARHIHENAKDPAPLLRLLSLL